MLSATVRSGISDSSWKMQTMPARAASDGFGEGDGPAGEAHLAGVGPQHARDDLDQRRLAGAVLAEHGVDGAAAAGEVDAFEGADALEVLRDAGQLDVGLVARQWSASCGGPAGGRGRPPGRLS